MAQVKDNNSKEFTRVDNEILKLAIVKKYNDIFRKDDTPSKDINWNGLAKLKEGNESLKKAMTDLLINDKVNPSNFKVSKMSVEVGEALNSSFDTKGIDLGTDGKREQLAKQVMTNLNSVYKEAIKENATSKQVKLVDVVDLYNLKGLTFPNLKELETTIRVSKAKISDLSEKALNKITKDLQGVA